MTDDTREALKSCPFCGGVSLSTEDDAPQAYISCNSCAMQFNRCARDDEFHPDSFHHMKAAWNTRASQTVTDEMVEALKEDARRLDFLDQLNASLNQHTSSNYGWKIDVNHNRVRVKPTHPSDGWNCIDFTDAGFPVKTIRQAIDGAHSTALAEAALKVGG